MSQDNSPADAASDAASTESSLLDAAIELYGRYGTHAVSLNQIRRHANVSNDAAIRYYFRNKAGLLTRSTERIAEQLNASLEAVAGQLEATGGGALAVREILMSFGMPFISLHAQQPHSLSFIGSLMRDEGDFGHQLLNRFFGQVLLRFERLIAEALPSKPPELIHLHFYLAVNNLVHGLDDMRILQFMPGLTEDCQTLIDRPAVLVAGFLDYVCAGLERLPETT
ncbi:MAG: TetR family transcriptional regulator [Pseudomonadota bacterium]|nr:TetR family transcriptional regulator [Pseudomonadota bacterium]